MFVLELGPAHKHRDPTISYALACLLLYQQAILILQMLSYDITVHLPVSAQTHLSQDSTYICTINDSSCFHMADVILNLAMFSSF